MNTLNISPKLSLKHIQDVRILIVAVLYFAAAWLAHVLSFNNSTALPTWPPSGIGFALILLLGRSTWPGISIGSLIASIMSYWYTDFSNPHTIILITCGVALSSTCEALLGNFLIKKWIVDPYPFNSTKNAFRFLFVTMLMALSAALIGALSLVVGNVIQDAVFVRTVFFWWVGNVVGIVLFTPFVLSLTQKFSANITTEKLVEVVVFIFGVLLVYVIFQVDFLKPTLQKALPFLALPVLLWIAYRFDFILAITGVLVTSLAAVYFTIHNAGPFAMRNPENAMLLLQIFIGVIAVSTLVLSATVKERREAQRLLLNFNFNLENMVHERTKALNEEIRTRIQAEENIQQTNKELSKRNSELDNFVYSVSHDLRAPIASVLGLINLAKKDDDLVMKDMYLDMIHKSALQQDHFIKEILDQSRNARLDVKREAIYFKPLIEEAFNHLKFASSNGKTIERVINVEQPRAFYSDAWRLKVILNNIISNSIRYRNGREPMININVSVDDARATVVIRDNGKGIEKEHLPNLCKMFYRATDDGAGSGLGLYIVKETVDKLKGHIDIDSEFGKGTTVSLSIPDMH